MRRVRKRRFGRECDNVSNIPGTHIIKVGWNIAPKDATRPKPAKLNGFLIAWNNRDANNRLIVDYPAMERLGYSSQQIARAQKEHFKAPSECLPQILRFFLVNDATRNQDGEYEFPKTLQDLYECYLDGKRFCYGDGVTAKRSQPDGTVKTIKCIPFGADGFEAKDFCKYSKEGKCKDNVAFSCCLYTLIGNKPAPLSPELGMNARFTLTTTSEYCGIDGYEELDAIASRLDGNMCGLTGTLIFQKVGRRTGNEKVPKAIVGHVSIKIDLEAVIARERQLNGQLLGRTEALAIGGKTLALPPVDEIRPQMEEPDNQPEDIEDAEVIEPEAPPAEQDPKEDKESGEYVTPKQLNRITELSNEVKVDIEAVLRKKGFEDLTYLTASQAEDTIAWLESKRKAEPVPVGAGESLFD